MLWKIKIRLAGIALLLFLCPTSLLHSQSSPAKLDSLINETNKAKEDTNKVKLLIELGNEMSYTDLNKALAYLQQGYALSNKLNYEFGKARNAYLLGITYIDAGNYSLGDSFINIAEIKFEKMQHTRQLAMVENARGSFNFMQGNYWGAGEHFTKAAEKFDLIKDTASSFIAYQNLIAILGRTRNYEKAVAQSKKLLPIAAARKDSVQVAYILQGLITDLTYLNKFDEAFYHLKRALDLANSVNDQNIAAEIYSTVGGYYYAKKNYANAINYFQTSLDKAEKLGNPFQIANHHNSLGQSYYRTGDFAKSKEHLLKGMALARQYNNKTAIQNLAMSLSSFYDSTGDYKNAYSSLLEHALMKDSILNSEIRNYTSNLEAQYETNKKETEILRLQNVEKEKNYQISRRNTLLIAGTGLILTLFVIMYLVRRNYRNKQKLVQEQAALLEERIKIMEKEKQISSLQAMVNGQETERTRVARDLHDGVGGLFSTVKMHYSSLHHETPEIKNNSLYKKTGDLINNAADELRKVAHNMMPEVLMKMGLRDALQDLCNNTSAGRSLFVRLDSYGMEKRLNSSTEVMLYRIIQELVSNIIKHAGATEAVIQLNRQDSRLSLLVEDNGTGFDTAEATGKRSMGMETVKSRVNYLEGQLSIDSRKDIGTTILIDIPVE